MSTIKQKNAAKSTAAVAAGVVGYAALSGETPVNAAQASSAEATSAAPAAQQPILAAAAPEAIQIDQLVQSHLGEDLSGMPSAEALTAADLSDMLVEPETLEALASQPSAGLNEGSGEAAGGLPAGLAGLSGLSAAQIAAIIAGVVATGAVVNEITGC